MAPETKEVLDYLVALLGPASLGGIILGFFGWMRARAEKPHIADDRPGLSGATMAHLGGMVMGQQVSEDLIEALRGIAASHDRCTLTREAEMELRRRLANDRHEQMRALIDALRSANDQLARRAP